MKEQLQAWFKKHFSDPEALTMLLFLLGTVALFMLFGSMLVPLIWALVIAYLLEWLVQTMLGKGVRRTLAVCLVFLIFIGFLSSIFLGLLPLLVGQVASLAEEFPQMINNGRSLLVKLQADYPTFIDVDKVLPYLQTEVTQLGQQIFSKSIAGIPALLTLLIYLVLVPLLVFFFLKDKVLITGCLAGFLPNKRKLIAKVWHEMDGQIGNYVRGKVIEILIVGSVSYIVFYLMELRYAALLGALVGLSVLVPYVGAALVTIPIAFVAFFQPGWGWSSEFAYLMLAYGIIQALDGNVLVPLLFSEAVNLHPVAIIVAILIFGGMWGLWGVFFAIPLATLVKAVFNAWPSSFTSVEDNS